MVVGGGGRGVVRRGLLEVGRDFALRRAAAEGLCLAIAARSLAGATPRPTLMFGPSHLSQSLPSGRCPAKAPPSNPCNSRPHIELGKCPCFFTLVYGSTGDNESGRPPRRQGYKTRRRASLAWHPIHPIRRDVLTTGGAPLRLRSFSRFFSKEQLIRPPRSVPHRPHRLHPHQPRDILSHFLPPTQRRRAGHLVSVSLSLDCDIAASACVLTPGERDAQGFLLGLREAARRRMIPRLGI